MNYTPPKILFSAHLETIFPALFRKVAGVEYKRERISTLDDDFLDLDWVHNDSGKLLIISHGLEGSSDRPYIKGMAKAFSNAGFDILAWNFRGCSEEINKQLHFYHSGATDDLHLVVQHAMALGYKEINLLGFSLGGNLTLKYLGEDNRKEINRAVAFSVPLDLHTSCIKITERSNFLYSRRFLKNLKSKVREKAKTRPDELQIKNLKDIKTLMAFDDAYTAPLHGFKDAVDYYNQCSSINFIDNIETPTLIVNAKNDPFLSNECYPTERFKDHPFVTINAPERGGHVGFASFNSENVYWSEEQAVEFISGQ